MDQIDPEYDFPSVILIAGSSIASQWIQSDQFILCKVGREQSFARGVMFHFLASQPSLASQSSQCP
jgi:hypothetical protein